MYQIGIKIPVNKPVEEIIQKAVLLNSKVGEYRISNNSFVVVGYNYKIDDSNIYNSLVDEYGITVNAINLSDVDI